MQWLWWWWWWWYPEYIIHVVSDSFSFFYFICLIYYPLPMAFYSFFFSLYGCHFISFHFVSYSYSGCFCLSLGYPRWCASFFCISQFFFSFRIIFSWQLPPTQQQLVCVSNYPWSIFFSANIYFFDYSIFSHSDYSELISHDNDG